MGFLVKLFRIMPTQEYIPCLTLFFLMIISAILEAIGIGAILPLISAMGNTDFLHEHVNISIITSRIGIYEHNTFILFCALGLMLFYFVKNLFVAFAIRMQICFVIRNQILYSKHLLKEYLFKPYIFHVCHNTTTLLYNVNDGASVVFASIVLPLLGLLTECATSIAIWIMLLTIDSFTAIVVAGVLGGLIAVIVKSFRKRVVYQGEIQNNYHVQYLTWANQALGAIKETKTMHAETYFLTKFSIAYRLFGEAHGAFDFLNQVPRLLIEIVVVSGILALIVLKVAMGTYPADIVPLLGLLALAAFRLMPSANRIVGYYNAIKVYTPFFYGIYSELREIAIRLSNGRGEIRHIESKRLPFISEIYIDHLAFSYNDKQDVLKDVTFRIAKGDFVGIIGASGAGKTTFIDILLGLLRPRGGRILVDGIDIFSDVRGWQKNLAYVPQTIYLIDASIKENIAFGIDVKSVDTVWMEQVLQMAELYNYVQGLSEGIETVVGERGVRLSGGQRQRIGIARALYRKPQVLILDEATSALDNETEKSIMDTILKLKGTMTIISIAHRVSTLEECDYKICFHDGGCEIL